MESVASINAISSIALYGPSMETMQQQANPDVYDWFGFVSPRHLFAIVVFRSDLVSLFHWVREMAHVMGPKQKHSTKKGSTQKHNYIFTIVQTGCHFFSALDSILTIVNEKIIVLIIRFVRAPFRIAFHCLPLRSCQKLAHKNTWDMLV